MCFCPPSHIVSEDKGSDTLASMLRTAVVRWVSLTTSNPPYARSRRSGMTRAGSRRAKERKALCASPMERGSFENIARSAGVLRVKTKALRIVVVNRCVYKQVGQQVARMTDGSGQEGFYSLAALLRASACRTLRLKNGGIESTRGASD